MRPLESQRVLLTGLHCLPDQEDLLPVDGGPEPDEPDGHGHPRPGAVDDDSATARSRPQQRTLAKPKPKDADFYRELRDEPASFWADLLQKMFGPVGEQEKSPPTKPPSSPT